MPIGYLPAEDCTLTINMDTVRELGITIPDSVMSNATLMNE